MIIYIALMHIACIEEVEMMMISTFIILMNPLSLSLRKLYTQGGPYITVNLYSICLSEHEACTYADAVQICGNK